MALVPAICTQCGAVIEVENTNDADICKVCGNAFVVEKAINEYEIKKWIIQNIRIIKRRHIHLMKFYLKEKKY